MLAGGLGPDSPPMMGTIGVSGPIGDTRGLEVDDENDVINGIGAIGEIGERVGEEIVEVGCEDRSTTREDVIIDCCCCWVSAVVEVDGFESDAGALQP